MTRRLSAALILSLCLAACSKQGGDAGKSGAPTGPTGPVAAVAPPAGQDWTQTVAMTDDGGARMGNPQAAVKLVEYASLTCPHCRDFTAEAAEPLRDKYVRTGKVSWEYRPFLLNGLDTVAFLLARCQGAGPFFQLTEQAYASQNDWLGRYFKVGQAELQRIAALDPTVQFKQMAAVSGLDGFFRARGLPQAKEDQCLSDVPAAETLVKIRDKAQNELSVTGTPTFFVNGSLVEGSPTWANLDARLVQAVGG